MLSDLTGNKGLLLLLAIILCIVYLSPDVECIMLLTGIIVNVISICINTGTMKGGREDKKDKFVNMKRIGYEIDEPPPDEEFTKPAFDDLREDENLLLGPKLKGHDMEGMEVSPDMMPIGADMGPMKHKSGPRTGGFTTDTDIYWQNHMKPTYNPNPVQSGTRVGLEAIGVQGSIGMGQKDEPYPGAINWNDNDELYMDGNDWVASEGLYHQGQKERRQISGAMNIKKKMVKYLEDDMYTDEMKKIWWAEYDV